MPDYHWANSLSEAEILRRASDLIAMGELKKVVGLLEHVMLTRFFSENIRQILIDVYIRLEANEIGTIGFIILYKAEE